MELPDVAAGVVKLTCEYPDSVGAFVVILTRDNAASAVNVPEHPTPLRGLAEILRAEADKLDRRAAELERVEVIQ